MQQSGQASRDCMVHNIEKLARNGYSTKRAKGRGRIACRPCQSDLGWQNGPNEPQARHASKSTWQSLRMQHRNGNGAGTWFLHSLVRHHSRTP
jgi:hypothetical protein